MSRSALLVMDYQPAIVGNFSSTDLLPRMAKTIAAARKAGMPVIFVVVGFRDGLPEISPGNKTFSALKQSGRQFEAKVADGVGFEPGDLLVVKRRVSAYAGSDLEVLLRGLEVRHLVLAGISTSGVVLSTLRASADLDYELTVIGDCCADSDEEVHRVLLGKVFPRQARVIDAETFIVELSK